MITYCVSSHGEVLRGIPSLDTALAIARDYWAYGPQGDGWWDRRDLWIPRRDVSLERMEAETEGLPTIGWWSVSVEGVGDVAAIGPEHRRNCCGCRVPDWLPWPSSPGPAPVRR